MKGQQLAAVAELAGERLRFLIRPQAKSRPRANAPWGSTEFFVVGSNGPTRTDHVAYLPAVIAGHTPHDERIHLTQKPVDVLRELVQLAPPGGVVCDPFTGSGSTAIAARRTGRQFVGCELDHDIHARAVLRARQPEPTTLFDPDEASE